MQNSCGDCKHLEADKEDGNDGMGEWYVVCNARNGVSNLKQFPFKKTDCAEFVRRNATQEGQ